MPKIVLLALTLALYPVPFSRGGRKGPGIHCLRMCKIFLEFQETVFFSNRFRILNANWRWSSISSLWVWLRQRIMAASTEYSAFSAAITFSLGKLGLSQNNIEEGTALSNLGWVSESGCVSQQVPWKEYVLAVSTFPDGLQGPTRTRKMGQNVLTKQSASRLVFAHVWTSLMIFIANSRTNLYKSGACANSGYQALFFPPTKRDWVRG